MERGSDARCSNHQEFETEGGVPCRALGAGRLGEKIPNASDEQDSEGRPRNDVEFPRRKFRGIGAESPKHRKESEKRELTSDPNSCGRYVKEQPDGLEGKGEHR